jgi:hypothetical protein
MHLITLLRHRERYLSNSCSQRWLQREEPRSAERGLSQFAFLKCLRILLSSEWKTAGCRRWETAQEWGILCGVNDRFWPVFPVAGLTKTPSRRAIEWRLLRHSQRSRMIQERQKLAGFHRSAAPGSEGLPLARNGNSGPETTFRTSQQTRAGRSRTSILRRGWMLLPAGHRRR